MMIRKSAEIASKFSDVQNRIPQDTAKRVVKQDNFTIFYRKKKNIMLRKNRENFEHSSYILVSSFRCHAWRPALQLSCSSVSLSSSSTSNLFLQWGQPIFPNHSDLCHVIPTALMTYCDVMTEKCVKVDFTLNL